MKKIAMVATVVGAAIFLSGCASSQVNFQEPVGALLYIEENEYTLPVVIDLRQTDNPIFLNANAGGRPIRMALTDSTKLKGFLYVYDLDMDQVEQLAEVSFRLTDEQITLLKSGHAVIVVGYSARKRPVYKVNLGLDR